MRGQMCSSTVARKALSSPFWSCAGAGGLGSVTQNVFQTSTKRIVITAYGGVEGTTECTHNSENCRENLEITPRATTHQQNEESRDQLLSKTPTVFLGGELYL